MRRGLGWIALVSALPLLATSCAALNDDSAAPDDTITIGVALEKSGPAALLGDAEEKAIRLAADRVNEEGVLKKRIKLVITDTRSNEGEAVRQVTALADNDDVVGIIGPGLTSTTLPVLPIIEKKQVPLISMGAAEAIVSPAEQHKFSFKTPNNGIDVVRVMMRELRLNRVATIGVLAAKNKFGDYAVTALDQATKQANIGMVRVERFTEAEKDYTAQIGALVAAKPQAIVVSALMPGAGIAAKNIKAAGYTGRVFFDPSAGSDIFLGGAGAAAENMYMVSSSVLAADHITATTPSMLAQKEFFAAYTQRYGTFSGYASFGADALNLMVAAIRKANSPDRALIRDALENLEFDGLTGSFTFSPTNHGGANGDGLTVLTVHKGGWVLAP